MSCLLHARYNMQLDVLSQTKTQSESGEIVREWTVLEVGIPCVARGISGGGIRVVGSTERWGGQYDDVEIVKIQLDYSLSKRDRVSNIRDKNGNLAWQEGGVGLIFDVLGSMPVMDPFGALVEYDVMVTRAEIQNVN